jgi:hypothetical protein
VKERLTGAIIVVAALVLLVPGLLTGPESKHTTQPSGVESGAQMRSYTIDLQDDASRQPAAVAATDDPVAQAVVEPGAESPAVANVSPPVDDATRATGTPMGSGADSSAAAPDATASARPEAVAPPSAADDRPRSAFGPSADAARAAAAKVEAARA